LARHHHRAYAEHEHLQRAKPDLLSARLRRAGDAPRGPPQPASERARPPAEPALGRGHADLGRPGAVRQAVQAAPDQAGLHAGGRGARSRHPLRQRLLPDHNMQVRGAPTELQEHVQTQAPAQQMAGGGGLHLGKPDQPGQDRRAGEEEEKADLDRGECQRGPGEPFPQVPETRGGGDHLAGGQPAAREGSGAGLVLQPAAEGEAHDAPKRTDGRERGCVRGRLASPRGADTCSVRKGRLEHNRLSLCPGHKPVRGGPTVMKRLCVWHLRGRGARVVARTIYGHGREKTRSGKNRGATNLKRERKHTFI